MKPVVLRYVPEFRDLGDTVAQYVIARCTWGVDFEFELSLDHLYPGKCITDQAVIRRLMRFSSRILFSRHFNQSRYGDTEAPLVISLQAELLYWGGGLISFLDVSRPTGYLELQAVP